jgi:MarR family transcriptional regulator, organic hydroperoxide resistance regulator
MSMVDAVDQLKVLQQLGRTYRAFLSAYEKEVGHFLPRWKVMLYLHQEGKPCPQKQLGDASDMDPGALSRQLSSLELLGWIVRNTDQHDKRVTNVSLTRQGKQQVERSLPKRAAFIKRTLGDVSDRQLRQLMDALLLLETRFQSAGKQQRVSEDATA